MLGARDACTREKVSFQIGFEDSVRVGRSEMTREGISKGRACMSKITRGKSNVGMRLVEEIEGSRAKLTRWRIRIGNSKDPYTPVV